MVFEININLEWFCGISKPKKNCDHCWQQSKAMLLCDDVIIKKLVLS